MRARRTLRALAAQTAVRLNPSFALGHLVLGMARLFDGDAGHAIASLEHGLTLNPNDPQNVTWYILLAYAQALLESQAEQALSGALNALGIRPKSARSLKSWSVVPSHSVASMPARTVGSEA